MLRIFVLLVLFSLLSVLVSPRPLTIRQRVAKQLIGPELADIQQNLAEIQKVVLQLRSTVQNLTHHPQFKRLQSITKTLK